MKVQIRTAQAHWKEETAHTGVECYQVIPLVEGSNIQLHSLAYPSSRSTRSGFIGYLGNALKSWGVGREDISFINDGRLIDDTSRVLVETRTLDQKHGPVRLSHLDEVTNVCFKTELTDFLKGK